MARDWRQTLGTINEEATKALEKDIAEIDAALDEVNEAEGNALASASALVAWAKLGAKIIEIAGPIVQTALTKKVIDSEEIGEEPEAVDGKAGLDSIMDLLPTIETLAEVLTPKTYPTE